MLRVLVTVIALLLVAQTAGVVALVALAERATDSCCDEPCAPEDDCGGDCTSCVKQPRVMPPVIAVLAPAPAPMAELGEPLPIPDEIDPDEILHVPRAAA